MEFDCELLPEEFVPDELLLEEVPELVLEELDEELELEEVPLVDVVFAGDDVVLEVVDAAALPSGLVVPEQPAKESAAAIPNAEIQIAPFFEFCQELRFIDYPRQELKGFHLGRILYHWAKKGMHDQMLPSCKPHGSLAASSPHREATNHERLFVLRRARAQADTAGFRPR